MANKPSINLGLIIGAISIITFLMMVISPGGFMWMSIIGVASLIVSIWISASMVKRQRKLLGGFISLGAVFQLVFVGFIIGGIIGFLFQYLYITLIDPAYPSELAAKAVEMTYGFMQSGGVDDATAEEALRKVEQDTLAQYTPLGMLKSFGFGLVIYAIVALIMAAIMKRNAPVAREGSGEVLDA